MNRAKRPGGKSVKRFSNETQRYLDDAKLVLGVNESATDISSVPFKCR